MKLTPVTFVLKYTIRATAALAVCFLAACQPTESGQQEEAEAVAAVATPATPDSTASRPAPEFFVIPEDMLKTRVWICEDGVSDIFHTKHDCPILIQCKGKGTFRNLLLTRAIEDYGRYNCQECSKDLDVIFDKDAVREMGS